MSQVKITVKMGDDHMAIVTWSEQYGPVILAQPGIDVSVEEVEPRESAMVMVPVAQLPMRDDTLVRPLRSVEGVNLPDDAVLPEDEESAAAPRPPSPSDLAKGRSGGLPDCYTCEHPAHPGHECVWDMTGPGAEPGRKCGCTVYVT